MGKRTFSKILVLLIIVLLGVGGYFYRSWVEKQYNKCVGMYYVYKGDKAYKKLKLQKAIDDYNKGLELYPNHYGAWFNLGNIYVVYEDYESAAQSYQKAIEYNKKFTMARMNLGIVSSEKLGDFDEAIDQYNQIVHSKKHLWTIPFIFSNIGSEKTNKGLAFYNMGVAYRKKSLYADGNTQKSREYLMDAIQAYKNAARILKKDYNTLYNLALSYHLAGDYKNAGINYCKSIDLEPMNYEVHYNLAILLRHLRRYKESYNELEKASILISGRNVNPNTTRYVFDVLNQASKSIIENNGYNYFVEKLDEKPTNNQPVTYVNGKMVASDELDRAMLKNFKTCETKDYFENY